MCFESHFLQYCQSSFKKFFQLKIIHRSITPTNLGVKKLIFMKQAYMMRNLICTLKNWPNSKKLVAPSKWIRHKLKCFIQLRTNELKTWIEHIYVQAESIQIAILEPNNSSLICVCHDPFIPQRNSTLA